MHVVKYNVILHVVISTKWVVECELPKSKAYPNMKSFMDDTGNQTTQTCKVGIVEGDRLGQCRRQVLRNTAAKLRAH